MKTIFSISLIFFFNLVLYSQEKGLTPIKPMAEIPGQTYAVVVGISDYQDEAIPDLKYADIDAEAFAGFLQSPAGGGLDDDHLKLLLNEKATAAQFAIALDWLWEVVQENDRVIIYFSGHGDVERKSITQPGYLLCWDAPSRVYMAGGAFNVRDLKDVVSTLSVQNKAKVILVTDACRAGKLSGSSIGGSQATAANLSKQFANEIKILSCQPDEFSIEGAQWGGGRGAFSYHLLEGLIGMADSDTDNIVNLKEIGRYLEDHVTEEVAPQKQNPMVIGSKTEQLTEVFPEILAQLKEGKQGQLQLFATTDSRGIEDDILAAADTSIVEMYLAFKECLVEKNFLCDTTNTLCANYYYEKLSQEPQLEKLYSTMRRNYAAALQDDAQQVMNTMLKTGLTLERLKNAKASEIYKNYPKYLDRASKLLGTKHYMYNVLQARKLYFEGRIAHKKSEARKLYHQALNMRPEMPHVTTALINSFNAQKQLDSIEYYFNKSVEISPSWIEPYLSLWKVYFLKLKNTPKALNIIKQAEKKDSSNAAIYHYMGNTYSALKNYKLSEESFLEALNKVDGDICYSCVYLDLGHMYIESEQYGKAIITLEKIIELDPNFYMTYSTLGRAHVGAGNYLKAEQLFLKGLEFDPDNPIAHEDLARLYEEEGNIDKAENYILKRMEIDPDNLMYNQMLGYFYCRNNRFVEAEINLKKLQEKHPRHKYTALNMARLFSLQKKEEQAFEWLEKSIEFGLSFEACLKEPEIDYIRKKERFRLLLEKNFPEQYKSSNE